MDMAVRATGKEAQKEELQTRSFELYYKALTDTDVAIEQYAVEDKTHFPDTPTTIRLPKRTDPIAIRSFYRLALAHRAMHLQLGTFAFDISKIPDERVRAALQPSSEGASDFEIFFGTFSDVPLAQLIFEILEDARIDASLPLAYPGLSHSLQMAIDAELNSRPAWGNLPPRGAAVELALRLSMDRDVRQIPSAIREPAEDLIEIFHNIDWKSASVEQTALATVRLYGIVSSLPNLGVIDGSRFELVRSDLSFPQTTLISPDWWPEGDRVRLEGDDVLFLSLPGVGYRGSLGAFFTQAPAASGPDHQALYRMTSDTDLGDAIAELTADRSVTGPPEPLPHDHHDVSRHLHNHEEGELKSRGSNTFIYPEWDVFLNRYRNNWCRVVQRKASAAGAMERSLLQIRYANELRRLRRVMDIPPSQAFVTERRTPNGSEIDYNAAVDAMIDFRAGCGIHDSVYQDLRRKKRDISVLLLIDVSASTAERVENAEPIELALSQVISPQHKLRPPRILDIEVISSLLCTSALTAVGDAFAVWSFSGTGREQVILSEIKGFNEPFSGIFVSKAAAMKPVHATRLGSAVRHCGMVLSKLQSDTKVLLVLTDGRPFDIDYGSGYGEDGSQSYALADSDKALSELIQAGVEPYVLTVDPSGEEYVSEFKSVKVEVLDDVKTLPEKLLQLYRNLIERDAKPAARRSSIHGARKITGQTSGGTTR